MSAINWEYVREVSERFIQAMSKRLEYGRKEKSHRCWEDNWDEALRKASSGPDGLWWELMRHVIDLRDAIANDDGEAILLEWTRRSCQEER